MTAVRAISILVATVAVLMPAGGAAAQDQPPLFKAPSSDLVVLPVTVTDKQGRLVDDVPEQAFTLYDNDVRHDISLFNKTDIPVSIALVIDDSGSMRLKRPEVIAAALAFARWSHPEDQLFVIGFNEQVRDALEGRTLSAADAAELEQALHTLQPEGETALYDALLAGLDHLERADRARRILVLVSDGGDNASRATQQEVLDRARRSNVTIYTIGLFDDESRDKDPGVLKRLAEATGGARFLPGSPGLLMQACERIAREIRNAYTLGYEPTAHDGTYHRLRVTLNGEWRDLRVRTRPGYFASGNTTQ